MNSNSKKQIIFLNAESTVDTKLLANKGVNLCELKLLNVAQVPAGFIVSSECSKNSRLSPKIQDILSTAIVTLETQTNKEFGSIIVGKLPLLLSIRSSAYSTSSTENLKDTLLNLGMNDEIVKVLEENSQNPRWAYDTYRLFLQMFGTLVMGVDSSLYEDILSEERAIRGVQYNSNFFVADLQRIIARFKTLCSVPSDPYKQLYMAIEAIYSRWNGPIGKKHRDLNNLPADLGVAVLVQEMVFGNRNVRSGTGVAFTRNPINGANEIAGEFHSCLEGEEVNKGVRKGESLFTGLQSLSQCGVELGEQMKRVATELERHFRDMQEIEFVVDNGELYLLDSKPAATRTPHAAVRVAVDLVREAVINEREALIRLNAAQLRYFLHPVIDETYVNEQQTAVQNLIISSPHTTTHHPVTAGRSGSTISLGASAGVACGLLVFTHKDVMDCMRAAQPCIYCVVGDTDDSDMEIIQAADGVVTLLTPITYNAATTKSKSGNYSHAAVHCRTFNKPAVTHARNIYFGSTDLGLDSLFPNAIYTPMGKKGDLVTIDGSTGIVYRGEIPTTDPSSDENYQVVQSWARKYKRMSVCSVAHSAGDVRQSSVCGADGVGVLTTEFMFRTEESVALLQQIGTSEDEAQFRKCIAELQILHTQYFVDVFRVTHDKSITIRLVTDVSCIELGAQTMNFERLLAEEQRDTFSARQPSSQQQCLFGPDIVDMQTRAILGAMLLVKEEGITLSPQLLLPALHSHDAVDILTSVLHNAIAAVCKQHQHATGDISCSVGVTIATPSAYLLPAEVPSVRHLDFVMLDLEALTECVYGWNKNDMRIQCLDQYQSPATAIVKEDPFAVLDLRSVGVLVHAAITAARKVNPRIKILVCGEQCSDLATVQFLNALGVNCISCGPYIVPLARVAAAQAHISEMSKYWSDPEGAHNESPNMIHF